MTPAWVPGDGRDDEPRLFDVAGRETDAAVALYPDDPGTARVRVRGERLDDEPSRVLVSAEVGGAHIELALTSREARSFASEIAEAARLLEEGGR